MAWKEKLIHNENGDTQSGSKKELIESIENGYAVRVIVSNNRGETYATEPAHIWINEGVVFAQTKARNKVAYNPKETRLKFDSEYLMRTETFDTNGQREVIYWNVHGKGKAGIHPEFSRHAIKWFVDQ